VPFPQLALIQVHPNDLSNQHVLLLANPAPVMWKDTDIGVNVFPKVWEPVARLDSSGPHPGTLMPVVRQRSEFNPVIRWNPKKSPLMNRSVSSGQLHWIIEMGWNWGVYNG